MIEKNWKEIKSIEIKWIEKKKSIEKKYLCKFIQ